jgi:hypothetical protein
VTAHVLHAASALKEKMHPRWDALFFTAAHPAVSREKILQTRALPPALPAAFFRAAHKPV